MKYAAIEDADRVSQWKKRAEKLRSLARATQEPRAREELAELAAQWEGLARQSERMLRRKLGLVG